LEVSRLKKKTKQEKSEERARRVLRKNKKYIANILFVLKRGGILVRGEWFVFL